MKIETMYNKKNEPIVPRTHVKAVTDDNGNSLEVLLGQKASNTEVGKKADKTELAKKQETLVSGTNIKSVNGTSILGEGNISTKPKGGYDKNLFIAAGAVYDVATDTYSFGDAKGLTEEQMTKLFVNRENVPNTGKYGIRIDLLHDGKVTRIGNMDLHRVVGGLPVQNAMVAGYLTDDGKFTPIDWNNPETIVKDGSKGQMMVRVPKHYYNFDYDVDSYIDGLVSVYPSKGAFEVPEYYVSMYEACINRTTNTLASVVNLTPEYRGGNNQSENDGKDNTMLGRPVTAKSLTSFREAAKKRGEGWIDYDIFVHADLSWLFYIEYGTLNVQLPFNPQLTAEGFRQGGLGSGVSDLSGGVWSKFTGYYPMIPCGASDSLGNNSGCVEYKMPKGYNDAAADGKEHTTSIPRFHNIEHLFGHIYKWTDGVLLSIESGENGKSKVYLCRDIDNMGSTITDKYIYIGDAARESGYLKIPIPNTYGVLVPMVTGGSSASFFCDYTYTNIPTSGISTRGLYVGGNAINGSYDGVGYSHSDYSPSSTNAYIGSRLCYFPKNYDNTINE